MTFIAEYLRVAAEFLAEGKLRPGLACAKRGGEMGARRTRRAGSARTGL